MTFDLVSGTSMDYFCACSLISIFVMADHVKRVSRPSRRFVEEYSPQNTVKFKQKGKKDNELYEVEVVEVDKEKKKLKIHFVGYNEAFDEWRDYDCKDGEYFPFIRLERGYVPSEQSLQDRRCILQAQLYRSIKRSLWSGRRDDPETRIEINVEPDAFYSGLGGHITRSTLQRGREIYKVNDNRALDDVLGTKWDERILNCNGDFAFVEENTIRYWITKKRPIEEFKYIGGKYVKAEIEDSFILVFTFVRGDGNKRLYLEKAK